jgi:hypothetical protein
MHRSFWLCGRRLTADYFVANEMIRVQFPATALFLHVARQLAQDELQIRPGGGQHLGDMPFYGPMVESADTLVLGTSAIVREGANPSRATTFRRFAKRANAVL